MNASEPQGRASSGRQPSASSGRQPRIGLLALTLDFYEQLCPELIPRRDGWLRGRVLPALASVADVRYTQPISRREEIDRTVDQMESEGVDALLVIHLTYSPSQNALPALQRTRLPIIVWNTQELAGVDGQFDESAMIDNHGVHGTQDMASVLTRCGVSFQYITSHLDDELAVDASAPARRESSPPARAASLGDCFAAAAAGNALRSARIGLLGYPFPGMGDFAVDSTHLAATLGCQCLPLSISQYHRRASAAPPEAIDTLTAEYRDTYDVADDVTDEDLKATARSEIALRSFAAEHRLDALSYQFLSFGDDERAETLPLVAASRMMAEGMGFAGEGDVVGAAGTWLLGRLMPPASFSEIFTIDFRGNGLALSHMGEANVAMARRDRRVPLVARAEPIVPTLARQLALTTNFEPGPATLCALTAGPASAGEKVSRWRLIASHLTIEDFETVNPFSVPLSKVTTHGDVREWLTAYAKAGGPHHNAICFGDARGRVRQLAEWLGAEYREV
jgi:L-arabinose isomerase